MKLALSIPPLLALTAWAAGCLYVDGPESRLAAGLLAVGFALAVVALMVLVRPVRRLWAVFLLLFLAVQVWWLGIEPSNDREWLPSVAHPATARVDGDLVTIENVRNFHYRSETDFDERWETRQYDLSKLTGIDMFLSYWGSPMIAHTITSWEFEGGQHLAVSIETRMEVGEGFSAVLGFFRQFELFYVAADERDLIALRTNHRGEQVFLYRLTASKAMARAMLLEYLQEMNHLAEHPRWYNALTHNCTTAIRKHAQSVAPGNPFSWKILVNGFIDQLGYERGTIDTSLPFEELRQRSDVTERGRAAGDDRDYSRLIRDGLPGEARGR